MRQIALDVHQGFCEVAIREDAMAQSNVSTAPDLAV